MKYTLKPTGRFQKDLKKAQRRGYNLELLKEVIKILAEGQSLPKQYKDHQLSGNLSKCRECHITPHVQFAHTRAQAASFASFTASFSGFPFLIAAIRAPM